MISQNMSSDSEISFDESLLMETLPSNEEILQVCRYDPKLEVSDHEDDEEPSMAGYGSSDTDSDIIVDTDNRSNSVEEWCICGNCRDMPTNIERYCCKEITLSNETILGENCFPLQLGTGKCLSCVHLETIERFQWIKKVGSSQRDSDTRHIEAF